MGQSPVKKLVQGQVVKEWIYHDGYQGEVDVVPGGVVAGWVVVEPGGVVLPSS